MLDDPLQESMFSCYCWTATRTVFSLNRGALPRVCFLSCGTAAQPLIFNRIVLCACADPHLFTSSEAFEWCQLYFTDGERAREGERERERER